MEDWYRDLFHVSLFFGKMCASSSSEREVWNVTRMESSEKERERKKNRGKIFFLLVSLPKIQEKTRAERQVRYVWYTRVKARRYDPRFYEHSCRFAIDMCHRSCPTRRTVRRLCPHNRLQVRN